MIRRILTLSISIITLSTGLMQASATKPALAVEQATTSNKKYLIGLRNETDQEARFVIASYRGEEEALFSMNWTEEIPDIVCYTVPAQTDLLFDDYFLLNSYTNRNRVFIICNNSVRTLNSTDIGRFKSNAACATLRNDGLIIEKSFRDAPIKEAHQSQAKTNNNLRVTLENKAGVSEALLFVTTAKRVVGLVLRFNDETVIDICLPKDLLEENDSVIILFTEMRGWGNISHVNGKSFFDAEVSALAIDETGGLSVPFNKNNLNGKKSLNDENVLGENDPNGENSLKRSPAMNFDLPLDLN